MRGLPPVTNKQTIIRSCLVAFGLFMSVRVAIPDYPFGEPLWRWLVLDPTGFLHELFYIWAFVLAGVALSAWYEWQQTLRKTLEAFLGMGGYYALRVRKVAPRQVNVDLDGKRTSVPDHPVGKDRNSRP